MTRTEDIEFVGGTGRRLHGTLHLPEAARGSILMAHCFTCSKDLHTMTRLSSGLAGAGYAVLRFDFTGLGASGGEFSATTLSTNVGDLARAAVALIERGYGPCALLGHSLGGAAVILAAARIKTIRSMAVLAAPFDPAHVRNLLAADELKIRREGEAVVMIAGRPFPISRDFLDDLERHDPATRIRDLGLPLLVVHPVDDEIVPVSEGERIFAAARQPKQFVPLLESDHLLTPRASADQALAILADWFARTL